jgi:N6-adenosine-specific RNA methylase IME4
LYTGLKAIQENTVQKSKPPAQWINTDISVLPMKVLGKFDVVLIDPPWPIHMKLPYHQMTDQDIMSLPIQHLQDDGLIFLWVTSRALEKGIQCLEKWGYIFTSYITWAKTNQINSTIATGRTGHWLNHMKETCLVGRKGNIELNNGLDGDVIIEQVRETSRKPEKLYAVIERLVEDNARKLELFGRQHNLRHGWLSKYLPQLACIMSVDTNESQPLAINCLAPTFGIRGWSFVGVDTFGFARTSPGLDRVRRLQPLHQLGKNMMSFLYPELLRAVANMVIIAAMMPPSSIIIRL